MLTYRHAERPDFKGLWWDLFWIVWSAFWAGFFLARTNWAAFAIQAMGLATWGYLTIDRLRNMTWHVIEIKTPSDKEETA